MKYLENAKLEALASALSVESSGDCKLEARLDFAVCLFSVLTFRVFPP